MSKAKSGLRDSIVVAHVMGDVHNAWPADPDGLEPRWFDVISRLRGWLPLDVGEKMTVTIDGEMFKVKRLK